MIIRVLAICVLLQAAVLGKLQNGGFEVADPNSPAAFVAPLYWTRLPNPQSAWQGDCYASLHDHFEPSTTDWEILSPVEGDTFVLLSTDGFDGIDDRDIKGSAISQPVYLCAGDIILGSYFFGTTDYRPYNDYGVISLKHTQDPNLSFVIPGTYCDVETVGSYRSTQYLSPDTDGWVPFSHTIEPNKVGNYTIHCEVVDENDTIYPSYLAVDNLRICYGVPLYGDLNSDCAVDLLDFSLFTNLWLADCNDPNTYDPNFICSHADFSPDELIDPNDLILMSEHWLENFKSD